MKAFVRIILLLTLCIPCPVFAGDDEPGEEIELHEVQQSGERPRISGFGQEISCYLLLDELCICSTYTEEARVVIQNMTTGIDSAYDILVSSEGIILPLCEDGQYKIIITLSSGRFLWGNFII